MRESSSTSRAWTSKVGETRVCQSLSNSKGDKERKPLSLFMQLELELELELELKSTHSPPRHEEA